MTKNKVVLVPFPFDDLSTAKVRPAVCLTDPVGSHRHVILAFMTSKNPSDTVNSDLFLDSNRTDFGVTGLRGSATLRLHRLMTATTSLIQRELGELSAAMQIEVAARIRSLFGL
jgi:mRNA interferase MazF